MQQERRYHAALGRRGRVVRQRPAKPRTPVRFWSAPLSRPCERRRLPGRSRSPPARRDCGENDTHVRLGLIADIHGNLLALDAVLGGARARGRRPDSSASATSPVGPSPRRRSRACRELGCPVVMGNWDAAFLGDMPTPKRQGRRAAGRDRRAGGPGFSPPRTASIMAGLRSRRSSLRSDRRPARFFHGSPQVVRRLDLLDDPRRGAAADARPTPRYRCCSAGTRTCR